MQVIAPKPWDFRHYPCDSEAAAFDVFAPLVSQWQAMAGAREVPDWRDFDIAAFGAGWHDMMALEEVFLEPFDTLTVIWGSRLSEVFGYQPRGKRLRDTAVMRGLLDEDFVFFERCCREPSIGTSGGQLDWRGREYVTIRRLHLPCAPAGGAVDHLVSFCTVTAQPR
jgi:hypothetical protein